MSISDKNKAAGGNAGGFIFSAEYRLL